MFDNIKTSFSNKKVFLLFFYYYIYKKYKMARKKIPGKEKITLVKIWVKKKFVPAATKEAAVIEAKYK